MNPGDVVRRIAGNGEYLTVERHDEHGVWCYWFDPGSSEKHLGLYPERELILIIGSKYWG